MLDYLLSPLDTYGPWIVLATALLYLAGGFVKGAIGFAMPLICVTFSAAFLPVEVAVATVIGPVFLSNVLQAFRHGLRALLDTAKQFWLLNLVLIAVIWISAQILGRIDERVFYSLLGGGIVLFLAIQFSGIEITAPDPKAQPLKGRLVEGATGVIGGFFGGLAGIWGPPVMLYLVARHLEKRAQVRAAGLSFLLGSLTLAPAHLQNGVLNDETLPLSLWMIAPVMAGMVLGQKLQDRMDPVVFRKATMVVLSLSALNLLRKAIF
ncbi:MAG: sulfite exporter TauE/SafE family protein [Neomegalonema sp.]|nr:sulfite exporter TauE/SafE family protein [Neomegalonema sp.]